MEFSVSMSVYSKDNAKWFDTALKSVTVDQTVRPSEVVLIVDGPVSEDTEGVIKKYSEILNNENIVFNVIRLSENKGLGNALKIAVENCSHELIARMDSDDISLPYRFEQQSALFENDSSLDVCSGDISEFYETPEKPVAKRCLPVSNEEIYKYLKKRSPFNHMATMYKKSSVLKAGNYSDWFWNEDYYLWVRMALGNMKFANTGTVLANVRTGEDMYKRRGGIKYFKSEAKLQIFMLKNGIIGFGTFALNILKRFILQVLMPNKIRGWAFKKFARS